MDYQAEWNTSRDLKTLVREYERSLIVGALAANGGHQRRAADALGILPTTLVEKMKRLGIRGRRAQMSTTQVSGPEGLSAVQAAAGV